MFGVPAIDPERADRLTGLYAFEDGSRFHVTDLRDVLGCSPTLSITEYASGRLRALFPNEGGGFSAGSGWYRPFAPRYPGRQRGLLDESTLPGYPPGFHDRLASGIASQLR